MLAEIGIVDRMSGKTQNARARGSALSTFESAKLRFFSSLLVSMKMPSLINAIEQELASDNVVLVQLASTGEAIMDRRLSELSVQERATMDVEVSPKETLLSGDPDKTNSLQSRFMSSGSHAGADLRDEDIDFTPDN